MITVAVFVSDEFELGLQLEELGVFDSLMDEDSNFFINIKRLRDTKVPEFKDSYDNVNTYFRNLGILLKASKSSGDKLYKTAVKKFDFSEVRGINLGFSKGIRGAGFGPKLSSQIIKDASDIIKSGSEQPEIFHLTSLFEENVGPDRLSDMIATLIYDDIVKYTKRIYEEVGINEKTYPEYSFQSGLLLNPYKGCELLLLPIDILHELPIARTWDDIYRVVSENETIRREMSELVGKEWRKLASSQKKRYIKDFIFMKPHLVSKVIEDYKATDVKAYDIYQNIDYKIEKLINKIIKTKGELDLTKKNSYDSALEIIQEYKEWVENCFLQEEIPHFCKFFSSPHRWGIFDHCSHLSTFYSAVTKPKYLILSSCCSPRGKAAGDSGVKLYPVLRLSYLYHKKHLSILKIQY